MALIAQPGSTTIDALNGLLSASTIRMDASIAYATFSGARLLLGDTSLRALRRANKRFLVGIDWFRSEPAAIDALHALTRGSVKIVDGAYLVPNGCRPRVTYHPKAYLVEAARTTLIVGSANLSANGLQRSIELSLKSSNNSDVSAFENWFEPQWRAATPWPRIRTAYKSLYRSRPTQQIVVTEDDDIAAPDVLAIRWVTPERLRQMRSAENLWADVGSLHNRKRQNEPGTNLLFTKMTRVFFGHKAEIVAGNTPLLDVPLSMSGAQSQVRPMHFTKKSDMDRLSLPVPGLRGWPARYDNETLLFTKSSDGSFLVAMASGGDRTRWKRQSKSNGFVISMPNSKREWGVF